MATVPYQPQNLVAEQADGNILLTWAGSLGATGYQVQRSIDGVNFSNLATTRLVPQFQDVFPGIGVKYFYQVAAVNGATTSPYSSVTSMIAAPPSEMSLYELRLRAQQTADRVGSDFVVQSEWNAFLRLAMYELYDLLIDSYEDLFSDQYVFINTNGSIQNYPLPDGCSNYFGSTFPSTSTVSLVFLGQPLTGDTLYVYGVPLVAGTSFAIAATAALTAANLVTQINANTLLTGVVAASLSGATVIMSAVSTGPANHGIEYNNGLTNVTPQTNAPPQPNYPPNISPARAFYKLIGMDLNVNSSTTSPAWVTLRKYNFIDRNNFVYPNSTSTLYGVFNMGYRLMGKNVNIIPTPAGNQILRMWYAPKLGALLADTDVTTLGFSGWLRYVIVRAAKYALDKEEGSDTSKLDTELVFLKTRIEQASQNRDIGIPDKISETRREGIYGGTGWSGGGGNGGW